MKNVFLYPSWVRMSLLGLLLLLPEFILADALNLAKDNEGWTRLLPSADSRVLYISEDGNDATGVVYHLDDHPDPFNPSGIVFSFATYEGAYANTREGYPDWILYRRGDTFFTAPGSNVRSGRGDSEPFVIGSYGNSGSSPVIKTGTGSGVQISRESSLPGSYMYIAIQGLHFYAHTRNPEDPDFAGYGDASNGITLSTYNSGNEVKNILIEGCVIAYFKNNIIIGGNSGPSSIEDIDIRRNTILHSYSVTSHSQGLGAASANRVLVEENIFDHNGWLIQSNDNDMTAGGATFHNHNIYTDGVQNNIVRENIFMRASSIGTKLQGNAGIDGLIVDNNLYIDGEIGIESCNNYHYNFYRVHNPIVSNNIFYQLGLSNPTSRDVAWGMWLQGWDGGSVVNNLLLGQRGQMFIHLGLRSRGIEILDNIGIMTSMYAIYHTSEVALYDVEIYDNYFEKISTARRMIESSGAALDGIHFHDNEYYSVNTPEFRVNSVVYSPDKWEAEFESTATFSERFFPDDSRTIETYMVSLGETGSLDAFIFNCRSQERYHWDMRFSAASVNTWIRSGFGMTYNSSLIPSIEENDHEADTVIDSGLTGLRILQQ